MNSHGPARMQVAQKALIWDNDGRLLMVQYGAAGNHDWDLPGGRVEAGEMDLDDALAREVKEETGLAGAVGTTVAAYVAIHSSTGEPALFLFREVAAVGEPTTVGQVPEDQIVQVAWMPPAKVRCLPLNPCVGPQLLGLLKEGGTTHA